MKNFKYIIASLFVLLLLSGCEDFLIEEPRSALHKGVLFNSTANADMAVLGVYYDASIPWGQFYPYIGNYATDEAYASWKGTSAFFSTIVGQYTSASDDVYKLWQQSYKVIADANACVENIPGIEALSEEEEQTKQKLIAEAKFLRAFTYFDLVRLYGAVPLYLKDAQGFTEDFYVGRTSVAEVMDTIISDATFAYNHLPASGDDLGGRASRWAAATLLAKVYMAKAGHYIDAVSEQPDAYFANGDEAKAIPSLEKAATYLLDVEQNSWHGLVSVANSNDFMGYGQIFLNSSRGEVGKELIFDIQFMGPDRSGNWGFRSISGGNTYYPEEGFYYMWGQGQVGCEITMAYHDDDVRFKWNTGAYKLNKNTRQRNSIGSGQWTHAKFRTQSTDKSQNAPVYRYADVLLMLAEVINELGNGPSATFTSADNGLTSRTAYEYINDVRSRAQIETMDDAFLDAVNPAQLAGDTPKDQFGWLYQSNMFTSLPNYTKRHRYYNDGTLTGQYQDLFRDALQMERAWEMCFERHRWFDLKRWGIQYERAIKIMKCWNKLANVSDPLDKTNQAHTNLFFNLVIHTELKPHHRYLPIPQTEMMVNPNLIDQNAGY
ncbi:RagB/SusD family nutrient uptake outer membrane protein [Labilibacter sediminis]|nr:RagB/SusD family nutrient uptake outer membrane protein [Labilibacter sediminis]